MSSLFRLGTGVANLGTNWPRFPLFERFRRWLDAMPHPTLACEISAGQVAAIRSRRGSPGLDGFVIEELPEGAVVPSPVEPNLADTGAVAKALQRAVSRVHPGRPEMALLLPDPVVRVFLLHFETFPRRGEEAVPLLRWRLKKSVPFDVEDTVVSYLLQPARSPGIDVLAAVARQRILRQYEEAAEAAGLQPGVVLGSTLATLPLLEGERTTLLARLAARALTTVIVRGELLCVYRCTDLATDASGLAPQTLLDEIYPAVAFYQDTWQESVDEVRLAGLTTQFDEFRRSIESELGCAVAPLAGSPAFSAHFAAEARPLLDRQLEALVGWMLNRGA